MRSNPDRACRYCGFTRSRSSGLTPIDHESGIDCAALKDVTTLTITGTFEYQACDDRVCFAPQSIPLSWSIGVKPLDRERVEPQ